ncbi:MAG: hypothetical protein UY92_C0005G0026 [Candidatus Magasanikbacteria bacterium GW2011_GWA2_56_11]|uniref:Uncharacterized protein n=1 Tax=Candidatus Magasanikbacteria bacterium GW2011_GWA2_56_11 TaxID=1619044 RepID=A0A0G2BAT3_9BACT|nr:MAG: hypothetical protein UY92_C0005G0026 [Candidatus Magasanikbacteria bacterium GW2011_GWA2_56_11]
MGKFTSYTTTILRLLDCSLQLSFTILNAFFALFAFVYSGLAFRYPDYANRFIWVLIIWVLSIGIYWLRLRFAGMETPFPTVFSTLLDTKGSKKVGGSFERLIIFLAAVSLSFYLTTRIIDFLTGPIVWPIFSPSAVVGAVERLYYGLMTMVLVMNALVMVVLYVLHHGGERAERLRARMPLLAAAFFFCIWLSFVATPFVSAVWQTPGMHSLIQRVAGTFFAPALFIVNIRTLFFPGFLFKKI